jgi:hypothetical protein
MLLITSGTSGRNLGVSVGIDAIVEATLGESNSERSTLFPFPFVAHRKP